ncbi:MAG TPA: flagellar export protein FliJ [Burkholderiaceae bacterium]|nr:flagellar export protein FliJ [Burkholderiaceae bacterium]
MNSRRQRPLNLLVDLTRDQTNEAGRQLSQLVTERNGAAQQLDTLRHYREDYVERLNQGGQTGMTASNYRNFTRFLDTLDDAILQQNKLMDQLDQNISVYKDAWRQSQRQLHSYETLQTRQHKQYLQAEARREQLVTDEISTLVYHRRRSDRGQT